MATGTVVPPFAWRYTPMFCVLVNDEPVDATQGVVTIGWRESRGLRIADWYFFELHVGDDAEWVMASVHGDELRTHGRVETHMFGSSENLTQRAWIEFGNALLGVPTPATFTTRPVAVKDLSL